MAKKIANPSAPASIRIGDPDQRRAPPPALSAEENPPWMWKMHPARWTVLAGRVVPLLGRLVLRPGVYQVRLQADGSWLLRDAIRASEDGGWVVIPLDVDGPGTSYLREVAPGAYVSRFNVAHSGASEVDVDLDGYAAWLESLIERGVIPGPSTWALRRLREALAAEQAGLADAVRQSPSLTGRLQAVEAALQAVERVLEELRGGGIVGRVAVPPGAGGGGQ